MSPKTIGFLAIAALTSLIPPAGSHAQRENSPASPGCLWLPIIDRTEVVGDQTILFYMKDKTIYQNELPNACPMLGDGNSFMYRVSTNQLCDSDVVTVLERWGFGFTPIAMCPLGNFTAIDASIVKELKSAEKTRRSEAKK